MKNIAVIDTETNWNDEVMSIGVVISNSTYQALKGKYYILTPEYKVGGMYSHALKIEQNTIVCSRKEAMKDLIQFLEANHVDSIFAYNALFDYGHLWELREYNWYDILKIAAYRQTNPFIPKYTECYKTGRMKRDYGVEPIFRMLSNDENYFECHNALYDAIDELKIMFYLSHDLEVYESTLVNGR